MLVPRSNCWHQHSASPHCEKKWPHDADSVFSRSWEIRPTWAHARCGVWSVNSNPSGSRRTFSAHIWPNLHRGKCMAWGLARANTRCFCGHCACAGTSPIPYALPSMGRTFCAIPLDRLGATFRLVYFTTMGCTLALWVHSVSAGPYILRV